jgi:hypothetical protein
MKIQVKNIEFNPFRNISLVPIDRVTVEKLKESIEDLGLWAGMTARPHPTIKGKYQIPYGHHRLVAIQELEIKEIDISVIEISDFNMVLMMVQENMTQRGVSVEMINGTVREVKEFLEVELTKYDTWDEAKKVGEITNLFAEDKNPIATFGQVKGKQGVGRTILKRFLKNSIPEWKIKDALDTIKSDDIDEDAVNVFNKTSRGERFKRIIRRINKDKKQEQAPRSDSLPTNTVSSGRENGLHGREPERKAGERIHYFKESDWWKRNWIKVASELCRSNARIPHRMDRIKALGNSVNPYVVYEIFKAIEQVKIICP